MVIIYCPSCPGRPYGTDLSLSVCPACGSDLVSELASEVELLGRPTLASGGAPSWDDTYDQDPWGDGDEADPFSFEPWPPADVDAMQPSTWANESTGDSDDWRWRSEASQGVRVPLSPWDADPLHDQGGIVPDVPTTKTPVPVVPETLGTPSKGGRVASQSVRRTKMAANVVRGRVANYSNSESEAGSYRRLFVQRLVDAILYNQRFEDLVHRFTVRVGSDDPLSGSYVDVPVNVHGTIAGGMQLMDNAEVEVTGRYKNGVLMARRIDVVNGSMRTVIQLQHDVKGAVIGVAALALAAFLAFGGLASGGALFGGIGSFMATWLIMSGIVATVWFFLLSRMGTVAQVLFLRDGRFPLVAILAIGLLFTLAIVNAFGFANTAGNLVDSLLALLNQLAVPIIMVFGIALMISSILK